MHQSTGGDRSNNSECVGNSAVSGEGDCNSDNNNQLLAKKRQ